MMKQHSIVLTDGKKIEGTTREVAIALRKKPYYYSMTKIGKLLGQTRSNISRVLNGTGFEGRLVREMPNLTPDLFKQYSDEELAELYPQFTVGKIIEIRRSYGIRKKKCINMTKRQEGLCTVLFGDKYAPGSKFQQLIQYLCTAVLSSDRQKHLIMDFYFTTNRATPSENVYRNDLRKRLSEYIELKVNVQKLIKSGYLIQEEI